MSKYSALLSQGITYCDSDEKAFAELNRLIKTGNTFGVDDETVTLDPYTGQLRLVQIADAQNRVGIFDLRYLTHKGKSALADFLSNPEFVKIFHNAKFDVKFLKIHLGIKELYPLVCTMLEASLLACGNMTMAKSLEAVMERYLSITIDKSLQTSDWSRPELSVNQLLYSARDCKDLIQLHNVMWIYIKKHGMQNTFKIEMNCVEATAEMEINGMPFNFEKWYERSDKDEKEASEEAWKVYEYFDTISNQPTLFGEPTVFNINSHVQLKDKLRKLGIKIPTITERNGRIRETTGKDQLKEIEHLHPVIPHIINQRILHKAYTTYGRNWKDCINAVTKRIHANLNQNGSETGRFTTGEEVSDHMDPPMLGIPRADKFRNCFEAEEGRILIWGDYSQIELRILADFSGDQALLQSFIDDRDPHMDAAVKLFGIPEEKIGSEQRHLAKDLNYAIPYGVAPPKFALKARIPESESEKLMKKYFAEFPRIKSWLDAAGNRAIYQKNCRTASGRLLRFNYDDNDRMAVSAARRNGKNSPIQGTCSDIIKTSLVLVYKETRNTEIKLCHVFHDEIILECDEKDEKQGKELLERNMIKGAHVFLKKVPIKVDIKSGRCWGK